MTILNNDSHTGNGSFFPSAIPTDTIPAIVLALFILFINAFVVLLIGSSSSLRSTSNIILASLALSDFLMGLVGIPLVVACSSTFASPVCLSANLFSTFNSVSSVLHILVMTFDRYIFIMWALRYREIFNRRRVFAILSAAWLISLTPQLVRLSWTAGKLRVETAKEDVKLRMKEKEFIFFTFNAAVFFFVPLIAMIILDTRMMLLLRNQCQRIARENLPAESIKHETKMQKRQMKAVITCVLLLSLYVAFWLPSFIVEFLQHYATSDKYGQSHGVMILITYLRFCPALFNPIAYTLRKPDLKRAARSVVYKTFPNWKTQFVENRTEQIPLASRTDIWRTMIAKRHYLISFFLLEVFNTILCDVLFGPIAYILLETELDLNEQLNATFTRLSLTGKPCVRRESDKVNSSGQWKWRLKSSGKKASFNKFFLTRSIYHILRSSLPSGSIC